MVRLPQSSLQLLLLSTTATASFVSHLRFPSEFDFEADSAAPNPALFNWATIEPSADLEYHDCYHKFKCARLEVPLNWKNESDPRTVTIAIAKLPAVVPEDDPTFGGPVFTNPGGPGHSGVSFLLGVGHHLRNVLDRPGKKHYEIISFDPRGIGFTTPVADCYPGNDLARLTALMEVRGTQGLGAGDASLAYNLAVEAAIGQRCKNADGADSAGIFEHMNSPAVARDMVEMLDKVEELRKREQKKSTVEDGDGMELRKRQTSSQSDDVARLQYVGFSYGTLLGNYFASMYPGRVHRMILDSVCDADDYAHGPGWLTSLENMDDTFEQFFRGCHAAGPEVCMLARETDKTWFELSQRVWDSIVSLDESPLGVVDPLGYNYILTGQDLLDLIGIALYRPVSTFKTLAVLLNKIVTGDIEFFKNSFPLVPNFGAACSIPKEDRNVSMTVPIEAEGLAGVICTDGDDLNDKDLDYWSKYVGKLSTMSKVWGARWAGLRFSCAKWPFRAAWRFNGPFTTPQHDPAGAPGKPSAPLLFLSNRFDPVTPLSSARRMSAQHAGSRVVLQESLGHGVLTNARSNCTRGIVAEYFDTGVLPDEETECKPECGAWDDNCGALDTSGFSTQSLRRAPHFPLSV